MPPPYPAPKGYRWICLPGSPVPHWYLVKD